MAPMLGRDRSFSQAASGGDAATCDVTRVAIGAYAEACPLLPFSDLSYDEARAHRSGDSLAEFLVIELTEGSDGDSAADRFRRAAQQVDFAIDSLRVVRERLKEHAASSTCLALPLDPPPASGAPTWAS